MAATGEGTLRKVVSSGELISNVPHIVNAGGQYLFCKYWAPEGDPKCLVFLTHGYGAHCARFEQLSGKLNEIGAYTFSHDHIGHGESEGEGWYITDYNFLVRDVLQHVDQVRQKFPDIPLFIFGHSLGGCIAVLAALERPGYFNGVIVSGGSMVPDPNTVTPFRLFMLRQVSRFFPRLRLMKLTSEWLTRDKDEVKAAEDDPLQVPHGIIVKTAHSLMDLCDSVQSVMGNIEYPVLILHGGADRITNVEGSKMLYEQAKSKDKTLKIFPDMYHNMAHELIEDRMQYFNAITSWVKERLN